MANKPTRSQLKKEFFTGNISLSEFKKQLNFVMRYRGFYMIPGKKPRWSGPFRDTRPEADADNAPFFDQGYKVDVYEEQS